MSKAHPPELKKFMDKKLSLKLNGGRHAQGILRGFDPFMNLVIDECMEMATSGQQNNIGMVVIRGNSIIMLEALERVQITAVQRRNLCPLHRACSTVM
uniref:Small nuclear ribonucleoprotein G n=1 Tax=Saimiri boliviensis boliviensis TaxID=39432 RepID=A0A2K6S0W0_SAIBB